MEGQDNFRPEDQHDVAAFMRIFMDMMGMSSEHDIPHGKQPSFYISYIYIFLIVSYLCSCCYDVQYDVWLPTKWQRRVQHR